MSATEASSLEAPPARASHPYAGYLLRIGLGAGIVAVILWNYDARPILHLLGRENIWFLGTAIALYVAGQVMSAYRWRLLASVLGVHGPFSEFLAYYFVGMFTNLFMPGLIGSDAARSFYLGRRHHRMGEAIASVVADRGYGLLGLFWFAALIAILMNRGTLAPSVIVPTLAVGAITFAAYLASPLIARLIRLAPRRLRPTLEIIAPYLRHPASVLPAIALSMLLQASLAFSQYLLARGLGLSLPLWVFMLVVPIANVFASLPVTLNGLGLRETAYLLLFGMAGLAHDSAVALGLLWFATTMLGGLTGGIAFLTTKVPPARHVVDEPSI